MTSGTTSRDPKLDALKCIAIIAVIIGHAIAVPQLTSAPGPDRLPFLNGFMMTSAVYNLLYNVIQSVNMPLFAFVSGLLLRTSALQQGATLLKRRALTLMLPYLSWTLVARVPSIIDDPATAIAALPAIMLDPEKGSAWFLYALFLCYAVAVIVSRISATNWALAGSALVAATTVLLPLGNFFGARNVALLYPFLILGHLSRDNAAWRGTAVRWAAVALYPLTLALTFPTTVGGDRSWFAPVRDALHGAGVESRITDVYLMSATYHASRYICAASGIVLLYWLYERLSERWIAPQAFIGRRSLGLYVAHQPLLAIAIGYGITNSLALAALLIPTSLAITLVLERIPLLRTAFLGMRGGASATPRAT